MMKHFKNRKSVPTELSWKEKNPKDYTYRPSEAMMRLRKRAEKRKINKEKL